MRGKSVKWLSPVVLALLALVPARQAAAEDYTFKHQEILSAEEPVNLKLSLVNGSAIITGTPDDRIIVNAVKKVKAANPEDAQRVAGHIEIRADRTEDGIEVNTNYLTMTEASPSFWEKLFGSGDQGYGAVDYVITVPTRTSVTVAVRRGDITLSSVEGTSTIHSESGLTKGEYLFGPVTVVQTAGQIDLQYVEGDIRVRSSTGRASIRQLQGALDVSTESGNVNIQTELSSPKDYFVETGSGKITFSIPEESSGVLHVETTAGEVEMEVPVTVTSASKHSLTGTFGVGGPRITLTSSTGKVTVAQY